MRRLLTVIILISAAIVQCWSHRVYSFTSIGNDNGLSSNCVKAILRDSYDYMWFGTKTGLDRYDGQSMRHYKCYDRELERGNDNIGALYEDKDHNLWVGTDRGVYKFNPVTETFTFLDQKSADGVGAEDWVLDIVGDNDGNVWVLIPNQGVFKFSGNTVEAHRITSDPSMKSSSPSSLCVTTDGEIYVGTVRQGLYRYDNVVGQFRNVGANRPNLSDISTKAIQAVREYSRGKLLLFTEDGEMTRFNPKSGETRQVEFSRAGKIFLRAARVFDEEIWIGTQNGIYVINETDQQETYLSNQSAAVNGLTDNLIYTLYGDSDNNIWVGTMFGGVSLMKRDGFLFEKFLSSDSPATLSSNRIRGMATASNGMIYVGTEDAGVNLFDPSTGRVVRSVHGSDPNTTSVIIRSFGDEVYSGLSREGLDIFSVVSGTKARQAAGLIGHHTSAYAVMVDNSGTLWLGADWGLFRRRAGHDTFERMDKLGTVWVFDIFQDSRGTIWIAGMGDGVWSFEPATETFRHYPYDERHSNGLRSNSVSAVTEDSRGRIWISTDRGGLSCYNPETDSFNTFGVEDGLPDNVVYDVLEDSHGNLWFGTNRGLVKFNPDTKFVKTFTTIDGLPSNQFNYHAAAIGRDGLFYFGTVDGLISFNPEIEDNFKVTPVYFTSLRLGNEEITPWSDNSPLSKSLMFTDKIELPYDASHIALTVSSPNYGTHGDLVYSYRVSQLSDEWITLSDDRTISFASLAPGNYTVDVKVSNGISEAVNTISLHVNRPWYSSLWAWLIYLLIVALLVYLCWLLWRKRREATERERQYMFKVQADKELYANKVKFFSEIAHEIRTPLTLIETPLEAIEEIGVSDARIDRYLKMMRKNTSRLLDLVSQLLDFHKIGNSHKKLNFEYVNVSGLVSEIASRFQDSITLRNKNLKLKLPDTPVQAMIDKEAVTKIVSNLFSNAMKYAEKEIDVTLGADDKFFTLDVKSDGKKIVGENVYSIFTPFYQIEVDNDQGGVGIGLPLSRMLASLHNGNLELVVDNEPENTFRLSLPLYQDGVEAPLANADPLLTGFVMDDDSQAPKTNSGHSMLLVEDNPEMREFLHEQLSRYFIIDTAENGAQALELLAHNRYDAIVTDIMMPEMDGYELCAAVKADVELSHIPVVFLTAKNDLDSKVKALKCGGEAYIEKPFSIKFFRQQVLSLLENRRNERQSLIKKPFFTVDNMQMSKADEEFMNKVVNTIQEHIADENFNVETMADVLCMSRSSLLRKIKALFSLSPVELIRLVKLKKSAELIKEGKYRIGDICFMVGINSPSYFSKLFLKQFGMTPKAFEMQCQQKGRSQPQQSTNGDLPEL